MMTFRLALAVLLILAGALVIVRILSLGINLEIVPGLILGFAMIALGVHRLQLIRRVTR